MIAIEVLNELELSAEEQATVRRQLDRLLAHSSFRNSKRCQAFLRYVVEEKLHGNGAHLKERMIGVSVFHQPLDYDTNANSVVRVTAGEVRRRLAQYYVEADASDELMLDLPLGSYVPEFRIRDTSVSQQNALPAPQQSILPVIEGPNDALLQLVDEVTYPSIWSPRGVAAIVLCLCGASLIGGLVMASFRDATAMSESDRIWKGAFGGANVVICTGVVEPAATGSLNTQQAPATPRLLGFSYTSAKTAAVISSAIGHAGGEATLLPSEDTRVEDLQRAPAVLIGAFNNEWTMRLQSPLRYQFASGLPGSPDTIVDTKNSTSKPFVQNIHSTRDYGIFAHFKSSTTGQSTVLAAGINKHGTAAVRIFLSSPELLNEFSKSAPTGWEKGNYEIVFASDLVNNLADPPKIVATYFW